MCVWVEDADKLDYSSKELNIVYKNNTVKNYLSADSCTLGLAGVKGQGKTFLIKVKRSLLESNKSVVCFPKNRMVDTVDSSTEIDRSLFKYLKDYNKWVNLWKYAICSSIISQKDLVDEETIDLLQPSNNTKNIISANSRSEPSFVLSVLLGRNVHELDKLLADTGKLVTMIRGLRQSVCFFVDKLDQGFSNYAKNFNSESAMPTRSRNASIWQYAQYGLAEAAYDLFTVTNHHLKVFFTIRHEALIDSELVNKDKARNIDAYIAKLEYSKYDLKQMYYLYINNEAAENLVSNKDKTTMPSKAFIGLETIPHVYVSNIDENVFDYIFRHTFKRPYDMMRICRALYLSIPEIKTFTDKELRRIVNREADELLSKYLQELSIFLPCSIEEIERLLVMIPGNILNIHLVNQLCDTFYSERSDSKTWTCQQKCENCDNSHAFSILYNIGLIGYEKQQPYDSASTIIFENIGNRILEIGKNRRLPSSPHYYLHPTLSDKAREIRGQYSLKFHMNHDIIVGDSYEVAKSQYVNIKKTLEKIKQQAKKERIFVSSTIYDLEDERIIIKDVLHNSKLHPLLSNASAFNIGSNTQLHSHDVCLEEVKNCKSFIFVIGSQYGGEYSGDKYTKERDEIIALSKGKLPKPSISIMEYYIARKNHHNCYVFANKEIEDKKRNGSLDEMVKNEINFINHFTLDPEKPIKGNWINWYHDWDELRMRVSLCKFT